MRNLYLAHADLDLSKFLCHGFVGMVPTLGQKSKNRFFQELDRAMENYLNNKYDEDAASIKKDPIIRTPILTLHHTPKNKHYFQFYSGKNLDLMIGIKEGKLLDDETDFPSLAEAMPHFLEGKDEDYPELSNLIVEFSEKPVFLGDIRDSLHGRYNIHVLNLK